MNDTARNAPSDFKTCVRTSEVIYGQGEIYFCDNDSVVKLRDADFDVRNLRLEDDSDCAEFWFSQGVVIAVGGTTESAGGGHRAADDPKEDATAIG